MTDEAFNLLKALTAQYGRFNPHSEFSLHDSVRYLLDSQEQVGTILWAIGATPEHSAQYIITPMGLNRSPDMVAPGNMLGLATQEQVDALSTAWHYIHDDNSIHILKPVATIGAYYTDEDGEPWCTFMMTNSTAPCSACGAFISSGYSRGKLGEESFFCAEHIRIEQA